MRLLQKSLRAQVAIAHYFKKCTHRYACKGELVQRVQISLCHLKQFLKPISLTSSIKLGSPAEKTDKLTEYIFLAIDKSSLQMDPKRSGLVVHKKVRITNLGTFANIMQTGMTGIGPTAACYTREKPQKSVQSSS